MLTIRWSFDERIEDGLYAGYGIKHMKKLAEDPVLGGIAAGDSATLAALEGSRSTNGTTDLGTDADGAAATTPSPATPRAQG